MPTSYDPLNGLPKRAKKSVAFGPGPAEPKSPAFGGYGGYATPTTSTVAASDPVAGADPVTGQTPATTTTTSGAVKSPVATAQDLEKLINSDPLYKQAEADVQAARVGDQASRTAARQRALVLYGGVPDLAGAAGALGLVGPDIGGDITDVVRQLAASNTQNGMSTLGRLQRAHDDAVKQVKDQLTARGILSSGETGFQLGRQNRAFDQAQYDSLQQLVDYLSGVNGSYLQNERARLQQLADQRSAAAGRIPPTTAPSDAVAYFAQNPLPAGTSTADALAALAQLPPSTYTLAPTSGVPFNLFDANGQIIVPPGGWTGGASTGARRRRDFAG